MLEKAELKEIAHYKMPYGKFQGRYLTDIPEEYYIWHGQQGWPKGKLGRYMQFMYDLKANGDIQFLKDLRF